jgi:hypothetical protein
VIELLPHDVYRRWDGSRDDYRARLSSDRGLRRNSRRPRRLRPPGRNIHDDAAIPFDIEALDGLKQDSLAERVGLELTGDSVADQ